MGHARGCVSEVFSPPMTTQHDKAKRWKFGLRDLFIFVLIVGLCSAWWVDHHRMQIRIDELWFELNYYGNYGARLPARIDSDDPRFLRFLQRLEKTKK